MPLCSQAESSPCDQVLTNHMPRSHIQDSVWAPEPGNCRALGPVLEAVVVVCVSCPNVQSVLGGPHCLLLLRDLSQALCAVEFHEACLPGLSLAFFESTCFWLFVSLL